MSAPVLKYRKLSKNAKMPIHSTEESAGFDLCSAHEVVIPKRSRVLVNTDLGVLIPEGCYGRIAPRSKLAAKYGIDVGAGVVDRDYTGNIGVVLFNHSDDDFVVSKGDRIAQLICERIEIPTLEEDDTISERVTERGTRGVQMCIGDPIDVAIPPAHILNIMNDEMEGLESHQKWIKAIDTVMEAVTDENLAEEFVANLHESIFTECDDPVSYEDMLTKLYAVFSSNDTKYPGDVTYIDALHEKMYPTKEAVAERTDGQFSSSNHLFVNQKICNILTYLMSSAEYDHVKEVDESKLLNAVFDNLQANFEAQKKRPFLDRLMDAVRLVKVGPFNTLFKEVSEAIDAKAEKEC
ncbi:dUTPase [Helicoverpa zea nudivirus 2]|uniref:dUTP diphosphatase n=1 Tax=Helicoverpa zea nudivirus 2 TaxID=1128424 RepID=G9I095_HZNV2|nr:orf69 gene product [Helicoverpa zea nudivirus 2]AEW69618.1 dUTPase [Helicoverpa zea nudivirus 2]